jgi:class 3 adenylate cyclase
MCVMASDKDNLAILFMDVSDSTRLYDELGDTAAFGVVRQCLELCEEAVKSFKGRVVKTIGDGAMCAFPDASAAVQAACEMQLRLLNPHLQPDAQLTIRIGLHYGPVLADGEDVYGDTVNVAARMLEFASGGQIITTETTVAALSPQLREATRRLDTLPVKGKDTEIGVCEVFWQSGSDRTLMPSRIDTTLARAGLARLRLLHGEREFMVVLSITIGRDAKNGICVADRLASRRHAYIERRKNKFVLVDRSSNGTYLQVEGGQHFVLRREEMVLTGSGFITFGHRPQTNDDETVKFWCDDSTEVKTPASPDV